MLSNEEKRTIDVAYTKHEMLEKLQELRKSPEIVDQNKIYILTKHVNEFHALSRDHQIELVTTHGIRSFMKSLIFKETPIERALRRMNLSPTERSEYEAVIKAGGIMLISGRDPFNEQEWTGHTLNKWITNQFNTSNLINRNVKEIRQVPYQRESQIYVTTVTGVSGDYGLNNAPIDDDVIPLKDNQRYVRHPKTKVLSIYQGPHE